mmetsp:Transcript_6751/g.852  ORF Transcript_6751/g.852 Transcript_6751/m.852 type:complete len:85 (-) Transcript_6751:355-609(-)
MFGNVFLAIHKTKNVLYAVKTIHKSKIIEYCIQDNLINEKRIMDQIDHNMIVKLIKSFKDNNRIYLLMEFINGKDLFDIIRDLG